MADAIAASGSSTVAASPLRRKAAIEAVVENEELSEEEIVDVISMLTDNTAIADSYLALKDSRTRSRFLVKQLNKYNRDNN